MYNKCGNLDCFHLLLDDASSNKDIILLKKIANLLKNIPHATLSIYVVELKHYHMRSRSNYNNPSEIIENEKNGI